MATISRRAFLAGSTALILAPHVAEAQQQGKVYRLGCLWAVPAPLAAPYRASLEAGLRDLGWLAGQNVLVEHRFPDSPADVPRLAASVVTARVDVIVAFTNPVVAAAASATTEIPIVMVYGADPIGSGFAVSFARPGKNITGMTFDTSPELFGKHLELLKEIMPRVKRVQILRNPDWYATPSHRVYITTVETAARSLQLPIFFSDVRNAIDIERVIRGIGKPGTSAIYAIPDAFVTFQHGSLIAELARKHGLPSMFGQREPVEAGGLASYGPDTLAMPRYAASFVDRLFRGARASELPIEQPTKFELVINLKTAKALGLTIPPLLLGRADEVIQ